MGANAEQMAYPNINMFVCSIPTWKDLSHFLWIDIAFQNFSSRADFCHQVSEHPLHVPFPSIPFLALSDQTDFRIYCNWIILSDDAAKQGSKGIITFFFNKAFAPCSGKIQNKTSVSVTAVCEMLFQMTVSFNVIDVAVWNQASSHFFQFKLVC